MKTENKKKIINILFLLSYVILYLVIGRLIHNVLFKYVFHFDKTTNVFLQSFTGVSIYIVLILILYKTIYRKISIHKTFDYNSIKPNGIPTYTHITISITKDNISLWTKVLIHYIDTSKTKKVIDSKFLVYELKNILGKSVRKMNDEDLLYLIYKLGGKDLTVAFINSENFIKRDRLNKLKDLL